MAPNRPVTVTRQWSSRRVNEIQTQDVFLVWKSTLDAYTLSLPLPLPLSLSLTDFTVVCPWEAFGDMELSDLAKYGIV